MVKTPVSRAPRVLLLFVYLFDYWWLHSFSYSINEKFLNFSARGLLCYHSLFYLSFRLFSFVCLSLHFFVNLLMACEASGP